MTDQKIEPALTAGEWHSWTAGIVEPSGIPFAIGVACDAIAYSLEKSPAKLIALANAALPDDDPRKITRAWVERLRLWADTAERETYHPWHLDVDEARELARVLESYLPPLPPENHA